MALKVTYGVVKSDGLFRFISFYLFRQDFHSLVYFVYQVCHKYVRNQCCVVFVFLCFM